MRKQGTLVNGYSNVHQTDTLGQMYTVHPNN